MTLDDILQQLNADGLANLRSAIETGKWPDGRALEGGQRELCLQALIAWESRNLPEQQRSGYMPGKACASKTDTKSDDIDIVKGPNH